MGVQHLTEALPTILALLDAPGWVNCERLVGALMDGFTASGLYLHCLEASCPSLAIVTFEAPVASAFSGTLLL